MKIKLNDNFSLLSQKYLFVNMQHYGFRNDWQSAL
jgi:hypothetical protein